MSTAQSIDQHHGGADSMMMQQQQQQQLQQQQQQQQQPQQPSSQMLLMPPAASTSAQQQQSSYGNNSVSYLAPGGYASTQQRYASATNYTQQSGSSVQYGNYSASYGQPQVTTTYGPTHTTTQSTVTQSYQPVGSMAAGGSISTGMAVHGQQQGMLQHGGASSMISSTTHRPGMSSTTAGGLSGGGLSAHLSGGISAVTTNVGSVSAGSKVENTYYGASRFVTGEERVIGYNTIQQEERVISERVITHEVKIPKKVVREEVIEKVIIVPETVTREEIIEEVQTVRETVVEVAKPVIQEKIVEVPEIEYRDKIVEVVEKVIQQKVKEVPRVEYQERIVEVPKIVTQEKIVEVPDIEVRDVVIEKIVEVPEIHEQFVTKEVQLPNQFVEKPFPQYVTVEVPVDIQCNLPVPVEAVTTFEYQLAQFRPRVNKVSYPLYVPRFVEVPVAAELFSAHTVNEMKATAARLQALNLSQAVGLCEVENLASDFRGRDLTALQVTTDLRTALFNSIQSGAVGGMMLHNNNSSLQQQHQSTMLHQQQQQQIHQSSHQQSYYHHSTTQQQQQQQHSTGGGYVQQTQQSYPMLGASATGGVYNGSVGMMTQQLQLPQQQGNTTTTTSYPSYPAGATAIRTEEIAA